MLSPLALFGEFCLLLLNRAYLPGVGLPSGK